MSDIIEAPIDFFMNWIAGLPIELAHRTPRLRIVLLPLSLVWIPAMFLLFFPLLALWMIVTAIYGIWELMSDAS